MAKKRRIAWEERLRAGAKARRPIALLARDFFVEIRRLMAADPPPAELHVLRLAGKRLRYTLELFRPCYGPGLKQRLAGLQKLQQILGEINDAAAAERLLTTILPPSPARAKACRTLAGLQKLQQILGEINDAAAAERLLKTILPP